MSQDREEWGTWEGILQINVGPRPYCRKWEGLAQFFVDELTSKLRYANVVYKMISIDIQYSDTAIAISIKFQNMLNGRVSHMGYQIDKPWLETWGDKDVARQFLRQKADEAVKQVKVGPTDPN